MGQRQSARGRCYGALPPPPPRKALRGAGVTLVCVLARPGERWPDIAERPSSRTGVLLRELQTLGSGPPPPLLCGSAALPGLTLPQQELRVCAAPLASSRCSVPGRATLGPISVRTPAITILPGTPRLSMLRPKPE